MVKRWRWMQARSNRKLSSKKVCCKRKRSWSWMRTCTGACQQNATKSERSLKGCTSNTSQFEQKSKSSSRKSRVHNASLRLINKAQHKWHKSKSRISQVRSKGSKNRLRRCELKLIHRVSGGGPMSSSGIRLAQVTVLNLIGGLSKAASSSSSRLKRTDMLKHWNRLGAVACIIL